MTNVDPQLLQRVTVFSTCSREQLARLADAASLATHHDGEALTEEVVMGHRFHLLLEGSARAERGGSPVGHVSTGEFVGEIGLLGGGAATATVRCAGQVECLELRRESFWEVLEQEPAIALRILEVVCRRLVRQVSGAEGNLPEE